MDQKYITIQGARENNLKNISLKIPKDKLVIMTGVSGSGKTSLAFDTIYAEGQRRYLHTLDNFLAIAKNLMLIKSMDYHQLSQLIKKLHLIIHVQP